MAFIELTVVYNSTNNAKEIFNSDYIVNVYLSNEGETRMVYNTGGTNGGNIQIKETYKEVFKILKSCK